jgi:putative oxidoreductase
MLPLVTSFRSIALPTAREAGRRILATHPGADATVLRLVLGLVLLPHGAQHALGLFGGYGFGGTLAWMTQTLGFPAPLAAFGITMELLAPLALIAGAGTRVAALILAGFMATAASTHAPNGFFMNWFGALPGGVEGFEYHLLAIGMAVAIAIRGGGPGSIDRLLSRRA